MKIAFCQLAKFMKLMSRLVLKIFSKRINNYFKLEWEIIAPVKNAAKMSIDDIKKNEGEVILSKLLKEDFLIALDERGTQLTSEGLSQQIQHCANISAKRIVFLIGGAFGIHEAVLKRSNLQWSLSKLVFPHQLVRLILASKFTELVPF
ncbi:23S rRNA (pseudouridine(1915)-N(3))-methyltransferase RlmH [Niabella ginsengisoli]|uniref:23S rRNA (pseudouridine(1915)-N(3))-methyltransferase RlmH n=1 Tax=Niabella ginsengisoli TaxID=522298 RepID=UPI00293F0341|nr:23S rRNA (pseudouridine(1915)-N(3))-methyltransferase RlmH [Niabella ginsengisoli]